MTYNEADMQINMYGNVIGKPILSKMDFLDTRKITSLLITPVLKVKQVYSQWWGNGHNNLKAISMLDRKDNFEVLLISYNPSVDSVIYYLKLSTYLRLEKQSV
ncbi:MAG TPA: hypothetical protein PL045_06800 [Chitinophagaceae bacterium]|nr:hypothetical protein [Chitinophagaceae bacterium]